MKIEMILPKIRKENTQNKMEWYNWWSHQNRPILDSFNEIKSRSNFMTRQKLAFIGKLVRMSNDNVHTRLLSVFFE